MQKSQNIIQTLSSKLVLILVLLGILAFLTLQFKLGYAPCQICSIARVPYFLAVFALPFFPARLSFPFVILCFIFAVCVGIFHILVEEGVIDFTCNAVSQAVSIEEIKREIMNSKPECSLKPKIFGVRITFLSLFYHTTILVFAIIGLGKTFKN